MKASIECGKLRKIIGIVEPLDKELSIECRADGWTMKTVDPAHVAMVDLAVTSGYFNAYRCDENETIRVELEKVKNFLSLIKSSELVEVENANGKLVLSSGTLTRKIGLIENCENTVKVPKLTLPCSFDIPTSALNSAAKAGGSVSDHIEIKVRDGKVTFLSAGDTDEMELSCIAQKKVENARSLFPLDYFASIVKAIPSSDCTVKLGDDMPIVLSFSDGEAAELVADVLIAPRIEQGD